MGFLGEGTFWKVTSRKLKKKKCQSTDCTVLGRYCHRPFKMLHFM